MKQQICLPIVDYFFMARSRHSIEQKLNTFRMMEEGNYTLK